jgi:hypothetical protein
MADLQQADQSVDLPPNAGVGIGPLPPSLMRFNWGAFFLPALWGIVYGVWPMVGLWFVASGAPLFLSIIIGVTGSDGSLSIPSLIGITVVSDAFLAFVRLWSGGSANKLYWDRESRRLSASPEAAPKTDATRFRSRQRTWAAWGVVGIAAGLVLTLVTNYTALKPYGVGWAFVAEPIVFLVAQIALGAWLARQMRAEFPEPVNAAEPPSGSSADSDDDPLGGS